MIFLISLIIDVIIYDNRTWKSVSFLFQFFQRRKLFEWLDVINELFFILIVFEFLFNILLDLVINTLPYFVAYEISALAVYF